MNLFLNVNIMLKTPALIVNITFAYLQLNLIFYFIFSCLAVWLCILSIINFNFFHRKSQRKITLKGQRNNKIKVHDFVQYVNHH